MGLRVGVIGVGVISGIYFHNDKLFRDFSITACADLVPELAQNAADAQGIKALSVDDLLADDEIDAVLNLTVPIAHAQVSRKALEAGKHVYSEKPLATDLSDGVALQALANERGLRIGVAPDTVLGSGVQTARRLIDEGVVGRPLSMTAAVMSHGMEAWHPNPHFFFQPGAGPVLDIGPYYISTLINLLGPVERVFASSQIPFAERIVTSESPHKGERITVNTPTTVHAILNFASGVQGTFMTSWDVWKHGLSPIEIYGEKVSLSVPDPNFFSGMVGIGRERFGPWDQIDVRDCVFGAWNWPVDNPNRANYRGLGLAEMAAAIEAGRPHRVSGDVALHTLAVMLGILKSAETGQPQDVGHACAQPEPLSEDEAKTLLA